MRTFLKNFALLSLRIFFRRIDVIGKEKVPKNGPLLFVLNHNNALVDPGFVLCLAPRRVSFLAKAPLFKTPVVGHMLRIMESLPVYRRQDEGSNPEQNKETFVAARKILAGGGTIAVFPEGVSHSETKLKPLKTGAARIAIGASPLTIVPAGLYYTSKGTFRSSAVIYFGDPFDVPKTECLPSGDPPPQAVRELTAKIEQALKNVTLQADHAEALSLVARAERIFRSTEISHPSEKHDPLKEFELRRVLMDGYAKLRLQFPEKLEQLQSEILSYEAALSQAGIDPFHLKAHQLTLPVLLGQAIKAAFYLLLALIALPWVIVGSLIHYPAYRLAGTISTRVAKSEQDMISTVKVLASMVFFPVTWLLCAVAGYFYRGWQGSLAALLIAPLCGWVAMGFFEKLDQIKGRSRTFALFFSNPRALRALLEEREKIKTHILALEKELNEAGR